MITLSPNVNSGNITGRYLLTGQSNIPEQWGNARLSLVTSVLDQLKEVDTEVHCSHPEEKYAMFFFVRFIKYYKSTCSFEREGGTLKTTNYPLGETIDINCGPHQNLPFGWYD